MWVNVHMHLVHTALHVDLKTHSSYVLDLPLEEEIRMYTSTLKIHTDTENYHGPNDEILNP